MSVPYDDDYVRTMTGSGRPAEPAVDLVSLLVGQAMDDLDASRLDVESALRLVATIAWQRGRDEAASRDSP